MIWSEDSLCGFLGCRYPITMVQGATTQKTANSVPVILYIYFLGECEGI
jgi:hypothetical protein